MGRSTFRQVGQGDLLKDIIPVPEEGDKQPLTTRIPNAWIIGDGLEGLTTAERVALFRCWYLANKEAKWPRNQKAWVIEFEVPASIIASGGAMCLGTAKAAMAGLVKKGFLGKIQQPAGKASWYRFKDKARRSAFGKEGT